MKVTADPDQYDEAVDWFRKQLPNLNDDMLAGLVEQMTRRAKVYAKKAQLDMATDLWDAIGKAVETGASYESFKADVKERVQNAWGKGAEYSSHRLETVFRDNVQRAYGAGRLRQMTDPAVLADRPYWRYLAILDSRTSEICKECANVVLPANDPWWHYRQPPLHHRCRSTIQTMTMRAAKGRVTTDKPTAEPDEGFGDYGAEFKLDLSQYPVALAKAAKRKR